MKTTKESISEKLITSVILLTLLTLGVAQAKAADLKNAQQIIEKANLTNYYAGKDGRSFVRMKIFDPQGRKRIRKMVILRRDRQEGGSQDFLVYFTRPADVRKTVFIVAKHVHKDDDRWMYLPALDLVKRIAASDKRTSFVGSHFFYEDISGRGAHEDRHTLKESTDTHYVVQSVPKKPASVEFKSYVVWINKKTFLPEKIEYKNRSGKLYRRIEAVKTKLIDGNPTIMVMKATDLNSRGYSIVEMKGVKYNLSIPQDIFSERSLRTPPKRWLKKR
jgi:outer membrane lipoprotein-sorting protein